MLPLQMSLPSQLNPSVDGATNLSRPQQEKNISVLQLASDTIINQAYNWVCSQREERNHNNSVWHLRHHWFVLKPNLQNQLLSGTYRISPLTFHNINGELISSWDAMDALVFKALALTALFLNLLCVYLF